MSHARLTPGMGNSGKLVSLVRQNAKRLAEEGGFDLVLIDGPPGIGCPVIASLADIDLGLVVVEPTLSGIHDLIRALGLLEHFDIDPLVCVNRYDINKENAELIWEFCKKEDIQMLGIVPFDPTVTKATVDGKPVVEFEPDCAVSRAIREMWGRLNHLLAV